jgi:hypothetical protein
MFIMASKLSQLLKMAPLWLLKPLILPTFPKSHMQLLLHLMPQLKLLKLQPPSLNIQQLVLPKQVQWLQLKLLSLETSLRMKMVHLLKQPLLPTTIILTAQPLQTLTRMVLSLSLWAASVLRKCF